MSDRKKPMSFKPGQVCTFSLLDDGEEKHSLWQVLATDGCTVKIYNPYFSENPRLLDTESDEFLFADVLEEQTDGSYWTTYSDWDTIIEPGK